MHNAKHNSAVTIPLLQQWAAAISTHEVMYKVIKCDVAKDTPVVLTEM
jgi:hypothetical protein